MNGFFSNRYPRSQIPGFFLKKDPLHSLLNMTISLLINNCKVKDAMEYAERWKQFMTAKQKAEDPAIGEFMGDILCPAWWC